MTGPPQGPELSQRPLRLRFWALVICLIGLAIGLAPGDHAAYAPIRATLAGAAPSVKEMANRVELFEARRTIADLRALQDEFATLAALIVAGFLVGILLIGVLILEIGNRRRLLAAMRGSQEEARLAGQRFRAIAEAHPVAVVVIDTPEAIIRYANPAAAALLGMPSGLFSMKPGWPASTSRSLPPRSGGWSPSSRAAPPPLAPVPAGRRRTRRGYRRCGPDELQSFVPRPETRSPRRRWRAIAASLAGLPAAYDWQAGGRPIA